MRRGKKHIVFSKRPSDRLANLKELFRRCEIVIEVLDARDLWGTRLRELERLARRDRLIKIANKTDLLDKEALDSIDTEEYLPINSKALNREKERKKIINAILEKGKERPRIVVVGYPNVGKSTIINLIAGRKSTKISSIAGTTKNIQWIRVQPDILLMDSPGVFFRAESKEQLLKKGAINIDGLEDPEYHALQLAKRCITHPRLSEWLESCFNIRIENSTPEEILEKIARRRNWLLKGGELNILEASKTLLRLYSKEAPII